ncbi:MAG: PD40 domain-containing protein [Rickettsiales bacterium]|nr:PD40 domain-containing protein [Rickettsiales bacterium]
MRILKIFLIAAALLITTTKANAEVSFLIDNKEVPKTKILLSGFDAVDPGLKADIADITNQIRKNLKTTDLFEIIQQASNNNDAASAKTLGAMVNNLVSEVEIETVPDFVKYNNIGVGAILVANFSYNTEGNLEIKVRMWDVLDQRQLFGKFYSASKNNYKRMANLISDEIFKLITGEKLGHFNSQILYVAESGNVRNLTKKIAMVDFDGGNKITLTDGKNLVLTPIFSKKRDEIFYLGYNEGLPKVYNLNIKTFKNKRIGNFNGTTFAASIHPKDPNIIILSAIIGGNSDIYEMNITTNIAKKLTKSPAIDTTPAYSPDARTIAFASDRDSGQQLYVMDARGDSVKRISFGGGSYSKPVWSPDGNMIAFTKIKGNQFYVGIMSIDGKSERILTGGYLLEGVKWSPNGRYLIYSKKKTQYGMTSIPRLFIIDIVTGFEFEVPTPTNEGAADPDWA